MIYDVLCILLSSAQCSVGLYLQRWQPCYSNKEDFSVLHFAVMNKTCFPIPRWLHCLAANRDGSETCRLNPRPSEFSIEFLRNVSFQSVPGNVIFVGYFCKFGHGDTLNCRNVVIEKSKKQKPKWKKQIGINWELIITDEYRSPEKKNCWCCFWRKLRDVWIILITKRKTAFELG